MKNAVLTNDQILKAAGVTEEQITAIKTADATTAANLLEAIHKKLISFVYAMYVEYANMSNPLSALEKSYADHNGGSLNGMFEEILVPVRSQGANKLYGGKPYTPGQPDNPWDNIDYGADPIAQIFGINTKIFRHLNWDSDDFLQALNNEALPRYIQAKKATIAQEGYASRYILENQVLNCERFQYKNYADVPVHTDSSELDSWIHKVWTSQKYNEANTEFKRVPFNTTRGVSRLFFILEEDFWYDYAKSYQLSGFLKPFIYRSEDRDNYGVEVTAENSIIMVDKLLPTTLSETQILDPLNMTEAQLPANTRCVGRIVDWNAVKFGIGVTPVNEMRLDPCVWDHQEVQQLCLDMSDAYINVPILINTSTFDANRKFHIVNDTPTPASK